MINSPTPFDLKSGPDVWVQMFRENFPYKGTADLFCGEIRNSDIQLSAVAGLSLALGLLPDQEDVESPAFQMILVLYPSHASGFDSNDHFTEILFEKIISFYLSVHPEENASKAKKKY